MSSIFTEIYFKKFLCQIENSEYLLSGSIGDVATELLENAASHGRVGARDVKILSAEPAVDTISALSPLDISRMQGRLGLIFLAVVLNKANYRDFGISETE